MNMLRLSLAAIVGATISAQAGAASVSDPAYADGTAKVVVDCKSAREPHTADVAEVVGTHDMWQAFVARQRVIALAKPACERGADAVQFVAGVDRVAEQVALAAADAN